MLCPLRVSHRLGVSNKNNLILKCCRAILEALHALPSGRTAVRVFCQLTSISAPY